MQTSRGPDSQHAVFIDEQQDADSRPDQLAGVFYNEIQDLVEVK
jgi:hypothetical protein